MKRNDYFLLPLVLMVMFMPKAYAQTSSPSWHDENLAHFLGFVQDECVRDNILSYEKIYLHLDNCSYMRGDSIRFVAYAFCNEYSRLHGYSDSCFVELLSPAGAVVSKKVLPVDNRFGTPFHFVTDTLRAAGMYEIRAYTENMLKKDSSDYFSTYIPVYVSAVDVEQPYSPGMHKVCNYAVRFFPEGGQLVYGYPQRVAFAIESDCDDGTLDDIDGWLVREDQSVISNVSTLKNGLGVFSYTPKRDEKVFLRLSTPLSYEYDDFLLPPASDKGVVLNTKITDDVLHYKVQPVGVQNDLYALIVQNGYLYHSRKVFADGETVEVQIQKSPFTLSNYGAYYFYVLDKKGAVYAYRTFYVLSDIDGVPLYQLNDSLLYDAQGETCSYKFDYWKGEPFSLSIRARDKRFSSYSPQENIQTWFYFSKDMRGRIKDVMGYSKGRSVRVGRECDLLSMVYGWRCYDPAFSITRQPQTYHSLFAPKQPESICYEPVLYWNPKVYGRELVQDHELNRTSSVSANQSYIPLETFPTRGFGKYGFTVSAEAIGRDIVGGHLLYSVGASTFLHPSSVPVSRTVLPKWNDRFLYSY